MSIEGDEYGKRTLDFVERLQQLSAYEDRRYQVRRAASLRYCGDDIRFQTRPWAPKQLHHTHQLRDGDPLDGPDFPVVWRRADKEAA
jgi:hypothetical protein